MIEPIEPDLRTVLRRLKLSRMLDTLPERLVLARQNKTPHQDFLLLVLFDEAQRRDARSTTLRAQKARLEPESRLENWDPTAQVHFDQALVAELASLRFIESHHHLASSATSGSTLNPVSGRTPSQSRRGLKRGAVRQDLETRRFGYPGT